MEVLVLSGNNCSSCNTLKRLLEGEGFEYEEVDLMSSQGMSLASSLNIKSIPQVVVDGVVLSRGKYKDVLGVSLD